uniref:Uncharacterized protein n=1 Tax=Acrobeloides nanus TaxID=290746 RepID=A0A914EDF2_9BILA
MKKNNRLLVVIVIMFDEEYLFIVASALNVAVTVSGTSNRLATLVSANSTLAKENVVVVSAATFFAATVLAVV